jgi:hypothetical protein
MVKSQTFGAGIPDQIRYWIGPHGRASHRIFVLNPAMYAFKLVLGTKKNQ